MRVLLEGYPPPQRSAAAALPRSRPIRASSRSTSSRPRLGRARRADDDALRGGAAGAARDREVHARRPPHRHRRRQPLRARAARRRRTARSCGGPICCAACSPTGTTIRRSRTSSRACSSARRARRRASTRRGTTASTSSRSRSRDCAPPDGPTPPWLVDRVFRHLLVDVTGNTHRAEFCIDKLYSPDAAAGRRGLLELRAFEMPPHARMSLAQQLLLRALVARFWREPYDAPLDALGHRAARSLHAAVLRRAGLRRRARGAAAGRLRASTSDWFAPHFEFRFPLAGELAARGDPPRRCGRRSSRGTCWARKARAGGTARYVDSSVERLQVQVTGLTGERYVVTLQRPGAAAAADRTQRRVRRRRALPRLAAAVGPAPDDSGARAAHLRHRRHVDGAVARRLSVSRGASRAAAATSSSRSTATRPRAGGSRASRGLATRPGARARRAAGAQPRVPVHAGPAHLTRPDAGRPVDRRPTIDSLAACHWPICSPTTTCRPGTSTSCCDRRRRMLRPHWRGLRRARRDLSARRTRRRRRRASRGRSARTASPTTSTPTADGATRPVERSTSCR